MSKMQGLDNTTMFQHSLRVGYITGKRRHEPTIRIRALIITSHVTCHMENSYLCQHEGTYYLTLCAFSTNNTASNRPAITPTPTDTTRSLASRVHVQRVMKMQAIPNQISIPTKTEATKDTTDPGAWRTQEGRIERSSYKGTTRLIQPSKTTCEYRKPCLQPL